jgi:hypothetical protein
MAHFAKLDKNNVVIEINAVHNDELDPNNEEESGIAWLDNWAGQKFNWKQTSFNSYGGKRRDPADDKPAFRKNYAYPGYIYDPKLDAFYEPQPFKSWTLNKETCLWEPPLPFPKDGKIYEWAEANLNWQVVDLPKQ